MVYSDIWKNKLNGKIYDLVFWCYYFHIIFQDIAASVIGYAIRLDHIHCQMIMRIWQRLILDLSAQTITLLLKVTINTNILITYIKFLLLGIKNKQYLLEYVGTGALEYINCISTFLAFPIASSGTGTSDYQLQNRYCGGILTDTADAAADFHNSIIGILQPRFYICNIQYYGSQK